MSLEVRLCEVEKREWDDYVSQDNKTCFFHQWAYQDVVARTFRHKAYYLTAWEDGKIRGILPLFAIKSLFFGHFLVSLPFVDYGGICADGEQAEQMLCQEAIRIANQEGVQSIELRHRYPQSLGLAVRRHKVNLILRLTANATTIWQGLKDKVRNQVRKAEKSGLTFETGGLEKLPEFYQVWSKNMRDLGTPAYPQAFFRNFLNTFRDSCEILLVRYGERPVGTGLAVYFKGTMEIPWASSLREYFSKCPNNLLYWEAIKRACEQGCREFHFGRSTKGSGNYKFKEQWGAEDQQLYYQFYLAEGTEIPVLSPHNPKYSLVVALWQRLPLRVANILGPHIIKYIP